MTSRTTARLGAAAAVVAAAMYSSFLLAPLAHSRLPLTSSYPSELEANSQPWHVFFRATDALSGVLIIVVAVILFQASPRRTLDAWAFGLLALAGSASVADGATTMHCAPSLDAACAAKDSTVGGLLSQTFEPHTVSGLTGYVGAAAAMVIAAYTRRRPLGSGGRPIFGRWGAASVMCGFALWGVGLVDCALLAADRWFGITERARALLVSVWLVGAAAYLLLDVAVRPGDAEQAGTQPPVAAAGRSSSSATGQRHGSAPSVTSSPT